MRGKVLSCLLSKLDIRPILIDVGASGAPPEVWEGIAQRSIYVGFDPDLRDIHEVAWSRFHKAIFVNEAVTDKEASDEATFYLTKSPNCSSTLKPDSQSLSNYLFCDLFLVEREARVRATTLESVMERLCLPRIDWLKIDSQGTDLRIFNSLKGEIRSGVLAIDIEPGLMDAYVGEDLFVDAHRDLIGGGFWLSNLRVGGALRMRKSALEALTTIKKSNKRAEQAFAEKTVKKSPGWCEARYLRTIEWLAEGEFDRTRYVLLWIFSMLDGQLGFALDLAIEYERAFRSDDISQLMKEEPVRLMIRRLRRRSLLDIGKAILPTGVKRWLRESIE